MKTLLTIILSGLLNSPSYAAGTALFIDEPKELKALEQSGFDFARLALKSGGMPDKNETLFKQSSLYRTFVESIQEDLTQLRGQDRTLSTTMNSGHRLFNVEWLKSPHSFFELVGVVNRSDRAPFKSSSWGSSFYLPISLSKR